MNKEAIKFLLSRSNQNGNTSFIGAAILGSVTVGLIVKILLS